MKDSDFELVEAAKAAIVSRFIPDWHVVGAALRLRSGEVVTGVHIEANVGRIAICAEAVALGRAVTQHGSSEIDTIVAVYHSQDGIVRVVTPCGMCREMISDYAPEARVLVPGENQRFEVRTISELLPEKYRQNWTEQKPNNQAF